MNYKIISLAHPDTNELLADDKNISTWIVNYSTRGRWKIQEVTRLLDNQTFIIGEKLTSYDNNNNFAKIQFIIQSIELINGQIILRGTNNSVLLKNAQHLENKEETINIKQTKTSNMKVTIKAKKEKQSIKPSMLVYNTKSGYHAIVCNPTNYNNDMTTVLVYVIKLDENSDHTTLREGMQFSANKLDLEVFDGSITLENEK